MSSTKRRPATSTSTRTPLIEAGSASSPVTWTVIRRVSRRPCLAGALVVEVERDAGELELLAVRLILGADDRAAVVAVAVEEPRELRIQRVRRARVRRQAEAPVEVVRREVRDRDAPQRRAGRVQLGEPPQLGVVDPERAVVGLRRRRRRRPRPCRRSRPGSRSRGRSAPAPSARARGRSSPRARSRRSGSRGSCPCRRRPGVSKSTRVAPAASASSTRVLDRVRVRARGGQPARHRIRAGGADRVLGGAHVIVVERAGRAVGQRHRRAGAGREQQRRAARAVVVGHGGAARDAAVIVDRRDGAVERDEHDVVDPRVALPARTRPGAGPADSRPWPARPSAGRRR